MSYEGRYQAICVRGHYHEIDAYMFCHGTSKCDDCGEKFVETNSVDDTNRPNENYDYEMESRAEKIRKNWTTPDGSRILYSFKV